MHPVLSGRLAAATAMFALAALRPFTASGAVEAPVPVPAGIANEAGTVACVRTPDGGVEAIDLERGRTIFTSAPPARALLVSPVAAYLLEERPGRALQLAIYDVTRGGLVKTIDLGGLQLPAWATLDGRAAGREWTRFDAEARLDLEQLALRYDIRRMRAFGMRPPDAVDVVVGAASVSLDSGRVIRVEAEDSGATPTAVSLRLGTGGAGVAGRRTLDGTHALRPRAGDPGQFDLFDLATGRPIDTLERPVDVAVIGGHLLWTWRREDGRLVLESRRPGARRREWRRVVRLPDPPPGPPIP